MMFCHKNYFEKTVFITGMKNFMFLYIFLCNLFFFGQIWDNFADFLTNLNLKKLQGGGIGARSKAKSFFETVHYYAVFTARYDVLEVWAG